MIYKPPKRFNVTVYTDRGVFHEVMRCGNSVFAIRAFLSTRPQGWEHTHQIERIHCQRILENHEHD